MRTIKFLFSLIILITVGLSACAQKTNSDNSVSTVFSDSMPKADTSLASKSSNFWRERLTEEQYRILREKGTESPFTGEWLMHKDTGYYTCVACGNPLFRSDRKFDSECGWPSFDEEVAGGKVKTQMDYSHGMSRLEILCGNCGGHLGHLFDDGPTSTGKRYCVNSVSLNFVKSNAFKVAETDTITLGGGCFWCLEAVFEKLKGVVSVESGYSGGQVANPTYKEVCTGSTNHAEVVQIVYDIHQTSLDEIFKIYFTMHDPTTLNQQGADVGTQYRSIILYHNDKQRTEALSLIKDLSNSRVYSDPIVTSVEAFKIFYKAEISHQDYYENNKNQPYCRMVIQPKMEEFEALFKARMK